MKHVVISGANSGLGLSLAKKYLNENFIVHAIDINTHNLLELDSINLKTYKADVSSFSQVQSVISQIEQIDTLICNAGIIDFFPLIEDAEHRLKNIFEVNFYGVHHLIKACSKKLINFRGKIGVVSSESVLIPGCFQPYQISKIALEGYVNSIRTELRLKNVQITIIRPSAIQTPVLEKVYQETKLTNSIYEKEFQSFLKNARKQVGKSSSADEVARKVYLILYKSKLKHLYRIKNKWSYRIFSFLPTSWKDRLMIKLLSR